MNCIKKLKEAGSLFLALAIIIGMSAVAFTENVNAEREGFTLTLEGLKGHELELYQIFTGDLYTDESGNKVLSNIKYGSSWNGKQGDATAELETFNSEENAYNYTKELLNKNSIKKTNDVKSDSEDNALFNNLTAGYYLVKDKNDSQDKKNDSQDKKNGAYTLYILKVVGDATAEPKIDFPKVEKFVKDVNDSTDIKSDWQKTADHDIGDEVEFKLEATLPSNYDKYKEYKLVFHDELSEGFTFKKDSVKVTSKTEGGSVVDNAEVSVEGQKFDVTMKNLKSNNGINAGDKIIVTYKAVLNEKANIGEKGNPNKVYLEYSNNPNSDGHGNMGETPEDEVIVYTYKLQINKTDGEKPLKGAQFKLFKKVKNNYQEYKNNFVMDESGTVFTATGLDAGEYKIEEIKTPEGYNTMKPVEFTVGAKHGKEDGKFSMTLSQGDENGDFKLTIKNSDGLMTADVINKKGSTLPQTGGMGTRIIYIAGTVAIVGALGYFIAQRKTEKNN